MSSSRTNGPVCRVSPTPWKQPPAFNVIATAATQSSQPGDSARAFQPAHTGFKVMRITGDGSCMFRAIVQGAQIAQRGAPMAASSEQQAALVLRKAVVEELRKRREEIEPFLPGIADDFEAYLERMSNPAAWGGEPEMVMAALVIRRPICVWRLVRGNAEPIVTYSEDIIAEPVNLLWHAAGHYDLLVPESNPPSKL